MLYTLENGKRVIDAGDGAFEADGRRASASYVPISPDDIAEKLDCRGFYVEKLEFPRYRNRPQRRAVMTVSRPYDIAPRVNPDEHGCDVYVELASACFDHQGRMTVRLQPGTLRLDCDNEFYAAPIRIHHCSQQARDFVDNPVPFFESVMKLGRVLPERIESLRGVGADRCFASRMYHWFKSQRPRLANRMVGPLGRYYRDNGDSAWTFIQAVTDAQNETARPSPDLRRLATNLLTVGYDAFRKGYLPVGDALLRVEPSPVELN